MPAKQQSKVKLPVLSTFLLLGIFAFGSATGMFVYATGSEVVEDVFLRMVSHTEYRYGENGQIIARLVDFQGNAVPVINCSATILYPDKSFFANGQLMTASGNITGDHYYQFTTPNGPEGVYEYQATCFWTQGMNTRNQSVTNSFHLSSAFNTLINRTEGLQGNLTAIQSQITAVQGNLTAVSAQVAAVNSTLSAQITGLSTQLNANVTQILEASNGNFTALQNQLNSNVTQILSALSSVTVNLTPVLNSISQLNDSVNANFTFTNALIASLQTNMNNNFTVAFDRFDEINITVSSIALAIDNVNVTTTNTYNYVTGTLTTSVNSVLSQLGVINATVNRIESNTVAINATANTILENQQNQVYMNVFSG